MRESIGKYISSISKYIHRYINKRADNYNLNTHQLHILQILYNNEGISQNGLVERVRTNKISISKSLDGLLEEGYIEKRKNEKDKRIKNIYLTEKGHRIRTQIKNILKDVTEVLTNNFSKEEDIVIRKLLKKMSDNIYEEINL